MACRRSAATIAVLVCLGGCTGGRPSPPSGRHATSGPQGGILARFPGIGTVTWRCMSNGAVELAGRPMPYEVSFVDDGAYQVRVWSQGNPSESALLNPGDVLVVRPQGAGSLKVRAVRATEDETVVATALARIPSGSGCEAPSVRSSVATPRPVVGG